MQVFKVVLLGESAVGKSSLLTRLTKGTFSDYQESTIGAAFATHTLQLDDSAEAVKLEIWDTAGQERYHSLTPMYYRGAHAAAVVFDVTSADSFQRAVGWVAELRGQTAAAGGSSGMVIALVANKIDLSLARCVPADAAAQLAAKYGLLTAETSAKTGEAVEQLFCQLAKALPRQASQPHSQQSAARLSLAASQQPAGKSLCCAK